MNNPYPNNYIREACVENLQQAVEAQRRGADRVELCSALNVGGLTPQEEIIVEAKRQLSIPFRVMIRPRAGNFFYSNLELVEMERNIHFCKRAGVDGVVLGVLKEDSTVDVEILRRLISVALPLKVVFHKAIDETPDPVGTLKEVLKLKVITTVLTSGGAETALEGQHILKQMINVAGDQLEIMPAGKITDANIKKVHQLLGASAYHGKRIVGPLF